MVIRRLALQPANHLAGVRPGGLAPVIVLLALWLATAASSVRAGACSPVVGLYPLALESGPNFMSAPLHGLTAWRGTLSRCASNRLAVAGAPNWTPDRFSPREAGGAIFPQYLVLVARAPGRSPDPTGDWWTVLGNTADELVVAADGEDLADRIGPGDEIELRRLISLREIFGSATTCILNPDHNGFPSRAEEDIIRFVEQTHFTHEIFWHDGSLTGGTAGYVVDGQGPYDGSTITLLPGQPLLVFRRDGSTRTNLLVAGQVHRGRLSRRLQPGANPVAVPFPAPGSLAESGLLEAGWRSDRDGAGTDDDEIRQVARTYFTDQVYHHDGTHTGGIPTWVLNGEPVADYLLEPGRGYIFFVRGGQSLHWRQRDPISP